MMPLRTFCETGVFAVFKCFSEGPQPLLAKFTIWIDRRFVSEDYSVNRHSGVGLICGMPLFLSLLASDLLAGDAKAFVILAGGLLTVAMGSWAFWRWFKGAGKTSRSQSQFRHRD